MVRENSTCLGLRLPPWPFFQSAARLFDFLVLALDFRVLLGKLLRLQAQLFVSLLQFALLRLQFGGELLRLFEEILGLHGGFNAVEHDTDAGGQLFEESELRSREIAKRGQLDDRFYLILKKNWENDDVARHRLKEAGPNRRRAGRDVNDQHAPFFCGTLPDQAFADG